MSCFVRGCGSLVARDPAGSPLLFKHPRFGKVESCEDHGVSLSLLVGLHMAARVLAMEPGVVVVRCVECGNRPCVCVVGREAERREEVKL